jgi:tetratricopeptide (TPR) repeat protein
LGDDHPDVATSLNNLAGLYDSQGRYSEAEPLYQQALALRQRLLGDDHPAVASTLWHLGVMRYHQGQVAAAAALLLRALPIYQAKLGDHHPDTQNLKSWLAGVTSALLQEASGSSPGRNVG